MITNLYWLKYTDFLSITNLCSTFANLKEIFHLKEFNYICLKLCLWVLIILKQTKLALFIIIWRYKDKIFDVSNSLTWSSNVFNRPGGCSTNSFVIQELTESITDPFPPNVVVYRSMLLRLIIPCNLHIEAQNLVVYNNQVAEVDHSL